MSTLQELKEAYNEKYGEDWDRQEDLTEDEERAWVEACYDYYENECELKEVFGGPYSDDTEAWYGHPFEIIEPISCDDTGYDLISLPMWLVRITDDVAEDPGVFAAYPEELFKEED